MTERPMADGASTLTIMFTDIVGSTEVGARLGDVEAKSLRRAHDRILKQSFDRHGARLVESTGDGFMVAFRTARDGVQCAVDIQTSLTQEHDLGRYAEVSVRIGLHTTEPIFEDGALFGSGINMAARIGAAADGGQILVSSITRQLAEESFGAEPSIRFIGKGATALKGFEQPTELFEVQCTTASKTVPRTTRFVGRETELQQLRSHFDRTLDGQGGIVFVEGDAGVGKTRLVSEFAYVARDRGATVLKGASYESEGSPPYAPFAEALRDFVNDPAPSLKSLVEHHATQLSLMIPGVVPSAGDASSPLAVRQDGLRHRLFESVTEFLSKAAHECGAIVIVLDDLQWSDDASLLLLEHFSRRCGDGNILIVTTVRVGEKTREAIDRIRVDAERNHTGATISLQPLDREDIEALALAMIGREASVDVANTLFDATQGNPFYLEELVWHLQEEGHDLSGDAAVAGWSIPDRVRNVISRRLARLSDDARQMLAICSVLGGDLTLPRIAAAGETPFEKAVDLIDEATGMRLLQDTGNGYAFAHPLLREAVYEDLSSGRRTLLHKSVGEGLERLYAGGSVENHLAELAEHFVEAASVADPRKALDYARRAAEQSLSVLAYESAARLFGRALDVMGHYKLATDEEQCDLLLKQGNAHMRAGEFVQSDEVLAQAAEIARRINSPERLGEAVLGHQGTMSRQFAQVDQAIEDALERLSSEDSPLRVKLLARLAVTLVISSQRDRGEALSIQAAAMARRLADPISLAFALNARHQYLEGPLDNMEERISLATEMKEIGSELEEDRISLWGSGLITRDYAELGDMEAFDREVRESTRVAQRTRQPLDLWIIKTWEVSRSLGRGEYERAESLLHEALALGGKMEAGPMFMLGYGVQQFVLLRDRGQVDQLIGPVEVIVSQGIYSHFPSYRAGLALLHCEQGSFAEGRSHFEFLAEEGFSTLPSDSNWFLTMAILSEVILQLGDVDRAQVLYEITAPFRSRQVIAGNVYACLGSVSRYLGLLATLLQRWDDAEKHFQEALAANERMGAVPELARTRFNYADMLARRGSSEDVGKAIGLLDAAIAATDEIGMKALLKKACGLRAELTGLSEQSAGRQ